MSKTALIQLKEDAKAMTQVRDFCDIVWETNKRQKTQATPIPSTPLWNSQLTEEGYFSDIEYFGIKQYDTNDQLFKAKETPLSLYVWKLYNSQDRAKFESCGEFFCGVPYYSTHSRLRNQLLETTALAQLQFLNSRMGNQA